MPIHTTCPHCKQAYTLKDEMAGKTVKCKKCGQAFTIQAAAPPPPPPPAPEAPAPPAPAAPPAPSQEAVEFDCPECGGKISVTPDMQGQLVNCPYCQKDVTAPGPAAAPPAAETPQQPVPPESPEGEESGKGGGFKKVLIGLVALLLIAGIGVGSMHLYGVLNERNPATHLQRGQEAMKASNFDAAEASLKKAIELKTDGPYIEAHVALARLYEQAKRPKDAILKYDELIKLDKQNVSHYTDLAKLLEACKEEGYQQKVIETYEALIALDKDNADHHRLLVDTCLKWDDPVKATPFTEKASTGLQEIIRLDPDNDAAIADVGLLLLKQGKAHDAEMQLKKAASLNDANPKAHLGLGLVLQKRGHKPQAFAEFQKALAQDPNLPEALLAVTEMNVIHGKFDEAIKWGKKAVETSPESCQAHLQLGLAYMGKRQFDEAATVLTKACELDPKNPYAQMALKEALKNGGKVKPK